MIDFGFTAVANLIPISLFNRIVHDDIMARKYLHVAVAYIPPLKVVDFTPLFIKNLSERLESGRLSLEGLSALADDDVVKKLDEVKGIGRWTAEMFLIFSLNRADIFPADDLVIMKAMQKEYAMRRLPGKGRMHAISRKWKPYRSIATIYLWRSVDGQKKPKRTEL